jgi:hypothetical protein
MTERATTIISRILVSTSLICTTLAVLSVWQASKLRKQLQEGGPISYTRICTNIAQCGCPNFDGVIAGGVECDNSEIVRGIQQFGHASLLATSRPDPSGTGWVGRCIQLGASIFPVDFAYDCTQLGCKHTQVRETHITFNHDVTPATIWIRCSASAPR